MPLNPAIDPAYRKLPVLTMPRARWLLRMLSGLLRLQRQFYRWRPEIETREHWVGGRSGVRVLEVTPRTLPGAAPALVYFHGGAFFLTYGRMHLDCVQRYALEASCRMYLVDYRLSTAAPFPAPFDDCRAALAWVHANAATLGVDPARIAVMGDSAGGALAAGVAQQAHQAGGPPLRAQLLLYPVTDASCSTRSAREFGDTPLWNAASNRVMWDVYLRGSPRDPPPPFASPAHSSSLAGLPAAYVETAEFDPLRDEALDYARRLREAGVTVLQNETRGTVHGIDAVPDAPLTRAAMAERIRAIRALLCAAA